MTARTRKKTDRTPARARSTGMKDKASAKTRSAAGRTGSRDLTAAGLFLRRLRAGGIDYLFANGGTDFPPVIEAYAAAGDDNTRMPKPLVITHETVAVAMAHGCYLVSGRPQAVMLHVNVGLANAVMATINAASDNVPLLLCTGRTPLTESGRFGSRSRPIHWGQEMRDQAALVRESVKWDYELRDAAQAGDLADRALAIAMSEPRGPVYLSLPREPLSAPAGGGDAGGSTLAPSAPGPARADAVDEAARLLAAAKNPLIIAGRPAAYGSFEPLATFAGRYAIPVIEFWATRNALPGDHPMHGGREVKPWLKDADVAILLDAMVPWVPEVLDVPPACRTVALGADPLFTRVPVRGFRADVNLAGDPAATLAALDEALAARGADAAGGVARRRKRVGDVRGALLADADRRVAEARREPMGAAWVSRCISDAMGEDAVVFNDLGCDPSVMRFNRPGAYFNNPLSGGLGWALPAALGASLMDRDRLVIACAGDGSYIFANPVACHHVAAMHDLPVLTVIFNNSSWQAVRNATLYMYPDGHAARAGTMPITALTPSPDYAAIARAHGAHAERVTAPDDLPDALARAISAVRDDRRQALLDIVTGP